MTSTPGSETLLEAYELINGDRQADYGHPADDYRRVSSLFNALTGHNLSTREAVLFMVCVKLARLSINSQRARYHEDSLIDAIGYLGCYAMVHAEALSDASRDAVRAYDALVGDK